MESSIGRNRREGRPLVSVVVPTYNRAHLLGDSLRSVLRQTFQDLELIVVDDRSTDDTEEFVRSLNEDRIIYVRNERRKGASGARNYGVETARGRYVGFLDSDDQWKPGKLEAQVAVLEEEDRLDVVGCGWRWVDQATGITRIRRIPDASGRIDGLPRWSFNICQDLLLRREVVEDYPFDEELPTYEVIDWVVRIGKGGHRFAFVPEVLVECYDHGAARNSDGGLVRLETLERILKRHEDFIRSDPAGWSALNEKLGAGFLVLHGGRGRARRHLFSAIKARPAHLRTWTYAMAATIPAGQMFLSFLRRNG